MNNNPKVFISYSHDSQSHKDWVRQLATDLRDKGIDAILDQWELKLGDDLAAFMEAGVSGADRVIAICSENYVSKADAGEGGVGYEKIIVTGELVKNIGTNKFIPLVRGNNAQNKVPICLSSRVYIDFENDDNYQNKLMELLRDIYGEPIYSKPPLGSSPFEPEETPQDSTESKNNIPPNQEVATLDPNWTTNHSNTAHQTAKEHKIGSLWELNAKVLGHDLNVSQNILLDCARKSEIRTFGWPIGVVLGNRDEYKPRPSSNGIFANIPIGERESYDYWAWSQWGEFYLLKSLFEDRRSPGEIYFNTRIVRTTECLLYLRNMYENINVPSEKSLIIKSKYEGIANRVITSSNPNRLMFENRKIAENEASCEITVTLQQLNEDIVNCVKGLVAPLFILFDFLELKDEIYADIVNRFINGEVS